MTSNTGGTDAPALATRPDLDRLLDAALATGNETYEFDFKAVLDPDDLEHKLKLIKGIAAFTNTDRGGHLIIGVSDKRDVVGVVDTIADKYDQTRIQRLAASFLAPSPTIQVRQHVRGGKRLVLLEVSPFAEFPSIVTRSEGNGPSRLQAGTFIVRGRAAEATLCSSETDLRTLCDAIAARKANAIVEIIRRGSRGLLATETPVRRLNDGLTVARQLAESHWPSEPGTSPFFEVFFSPVHQARLSPDQLRTLFPVAVVPGEHGFPFWHGLGEVTALTPAGWFGRIPLPSVSANTGQPVSFLWLFGRDGTFLDREGFWEDQHMAVIPGAFGLYHLVGRLILVVRLLDRVATALKLDESSDFNIGVWLNNVKGRRLANELQPHRSYSAVAAQGESVEVGVQLALADVRRSRLDVLLNIAEEVAWQLGATGVARQELVGVYQMASRHLGSQHAFPDVEPL